MKKVLIVAAAAGLMTLAACTPSATNNTAEEANVVEANVADYNAMPVENVMDNVTDANMAMPADNASPAM